MVWQPACAASSGPPFCTAQQQQQYYIYKRSRGRGMRVLVYQSQQHGSHRQAWHTCICYRSLLGGGSSSAEADHAALLGAALRGHHRTPVPPPPPPPPKSKCAEGHARCTPTPACLAKAHALHTACLHPPPPSHTHAQSKPTSWFTVGDPPPPWPAAPLPSRAAPAAPAAAAPPPSPPPPPLSPGRHSRRCWCPCRTLQVWGGHDGWEVGGGGQGT